jgi:hypothetical protein
MHVADVLRSYELSKIINIDLLSDHLNVNDEQILDELGLEVVGDNLDDHILVVEYMLVEVNHIDVMVDDDLVI